MPWFFPLDAITSTWYNALHWEFLLTSEIDEWITKIGGSLNYERKQFLKLVDAIVAGEIACVVLAHQDRLARFGYQLLIHLCQTHQCKLVVMNTETFSPEHELVQDLITITHCFSGRLYGLRTYRKVLQKAIKVESHSRTRKVAERDATRTQWPSA